MPIFEYECCKCKTRFDKLIKQSAPEEEKEIQVCVCGYTAKRTITASHFALKGNWFKTTKGY